jgi:putative chitobiose transport system substrate-binding protein
MSGQLALIVTGANFLNMIKENAPVIYKNTIILPQLTGDTGLYDYSLMNFVIPKKAHNKEAALKFALYLTNENNQIEFAKLTTILPVNNYALNDSYFKDNAIYSPERKQYFENILHSDADIQTKARYISAEQLNYLQPPLSNIRNKKELNTLSANYIQQILINNKDIKTVLDEFSQNWAKL